MLAAPSIAGPPPFLVTGHDLGTLDWRPPVSHHISTRVLTGAQPHYYRGVRARPGEKQQDDRQGESPSEVRSRARCPLRIRARKVLPSKGNPIRTKSLRHASVHGVSIQQHKQVNTVIVLMHAVGLLPVVEASHPVKQQKKRAK